MTFGIYYFLSKYLSSFGVGTMILRRKSISLSLKWRISIGFAITEYSLCIATWPSAGNFWYDLEEGVLVW